MLLSLPTAGGLELDYLKVSSNPNHSIILHLIPVAACSVMKFPTDTADTALTAGSQLTLIISSKI